jgi:hypothetical protein
MVNIVGRTTDKTGKIVSGPFSLKSFFDGDLDAKGSDPRILYDALSGRWFATFMNFGDSASSIILAVSSTNDPTGPFCPYRLGNPTSETFLQDYPVLGISDDKIIVSYDACDLSTELCNGSGGFYVINKAQAMACVPVPQFVRFPPALTRFKPAQALSTTNAAFMAAHSPLAATVVIRKITGIPGLSPVTASDTTIPMSNFWGAPPDAFQKGSNVPLMIDQRTQTVVWQNNSLWLGGNGNCIQPALASLSCVRLVEVRTDSMTVRQEISWGAVGRHYFHPAVRPDASGNLIVVFMESSSNDFVSIRATGRLYTDPLNTLQPSILLRPGEATILLDSSSLETRIGDYSGAAVDPINPLNVWVSSEYIRANGDWGTNVAELSFTNPGGLPLAAAVLPASRSVRVGAVATAFVTIINAGNATATNVGISLKTSIPATFNYQTTNPMTNALTGTPNTPVDIPAGQRQTYLIAITPTAPFDATDVAFNYVGTNTAAATTLVEINTLLLSASNGPTADIVALGATAGNTGLVNIPGTSETGAFAVATVNVGASAQITASADTGAANLPVNIYICQTNPTTGVCLGSAAGSVTTQINAGQTPTFAIFVQGKGTPIAFDPANNRVIVRFKDASGVTRGATSVAVQTQ